MIEQPTALIDSLLFRRVLGHFASGVTVVTAVDTEGDARGITVSAFSSVSLAPPLVLVCVENRAAFCEVITTAKHFAVNLLSSAQQHLSEHFASKQISKFEGINYELGVTGAPLLAGTLGNVECSRYELLEGGDHIIVLGKVEYLTVNGGEPLIHFAGKYRFLQTRDA